jgi:hypothetical protein
MIKWGLKYNRNWIIRYDSICGKYKMGITYDKYRILVANNSWPTQLVNLYAELNTPKSHSKQYYINQETIQP